MRKVLQVVKRNVVLAPLNYLKKIIYHSEKIVASFWIKCVTIYSRLKLEYADRGTK